MEKEKKGIVKIESLGIDHIKINEHEYAVVKNYREAFQIERLEERYSEILERYDYIVGDMGYDQLRLRGFFKSTNTKAPLEWRIDSLEDYLLEYCNFGCPYFVLERLTGEDGVYRRSKRQKKTKSNTNNNRSNYRKNNKNQKIKRSHKSKQQSYISEKTGNISTSKLTIKKINKGDYNV